MDAGNFIAGALAEGAFACGRGTASAAAEDAYADLRDTVAAVLPPHQRGLVCLAGNSAGPAVRLLAAELRTLRRDAITVMLAAARELRRLLGLPGGGGEPGTPDTSGTAAAALAETGKVVRTVSGYWPEPDSGVQDGRIAATGSEPPAPDASRLLDEACRIAGGGALRTAAAGQVRRGPAYSMVIVIDGCSGIQIGEDNDQVSVYQVTLTDAALESPQDLAELLLAADTPWARDVFGHDARIPSPAPRERPDPAAGRIVSGPGGGILVITCNSRGVQVGRGNFQHNRFSEDVSRVDARLVACVGLGVLAGGSQAGATGWAG